MARRASQQSTQPTQHTSRSINQAVALLQNLEQQRHAKRARYPIVRPEETDHDPESTCPVYDTFLDTQGAEGIHILTNFSPTEFNSLWAELRGCIAKHWNVGSGRKSDVSSRDLLLMLLTALKHCGSWNVVAVTFKQPPPSFQKRTLNFAKMIHPYLMRRFVTSANDKYSMALLATCGHQFSNFPYARYVTDREALQYHYGHKVEVSVLPNGLAINCTRLFNGSVSDKAIFDDNLEFHASALVKQPHENRIAYCGGPNANQWVVMAEKGYQGIQNSVRAVLPKKSSEGILTLDDNRTNDRISSNRVIVVNYFGRMKTLWSVCGETYRWSRPNYDLLFQSCLAFTNANVLLHTLRSDDGEVYAQFISRLASIGSKKDREKKITPRAYRTRRKSRLTLMVATETSLTASMDDSDSDLGSNSGTDNGSSLII
ncbi:hypothetical protein DYB32_010790 [Aphanomyces invadans]|uniref:DDE Tnp4 domain-containing protein n=1 Tax=Aphanomyces invadans TaxID=157072 RepID=A0A418AF12_9STRA|nr:hypothetical protein DYB32_010790 [Aphanomyces invadans]